MRPHRFITLSFLLTAPLIAASVLFCSAAYCQGELAPDLVIRGKKATARCFKEASLP
jgi:hypothetical protein